MTIQSIKIKNLYWISCESLVSLYGVWFTDDRFIFQMILLQTRDHQQLLLRWYNHSNLCIRARKFKIMDRSQMTFEFDSSKESNNTEEQFKLKTPSSASLEAVEDSDKQAIVRWVLLIIFQLFLIFTNYHSKLKGIVWSIYFKAILNHDIINVNSLYFWNQAPFIPITGDAIEKVRWSHSVHRSAKPWVYRLWSPNVLSAAKWRLVSHAFRQWWNKWTCK